MEIQSKDKLFSLGYSVSTGNDVKISEEQRSLGFHILGAPREGKSKFLEHIVRHDIDRLVEDERRIQQKQLEPKERRSLGLLFLDPSAQGDTNDKILNYCASVGFNKVILIDPFRINKLGRIPPINPFFMPTRRITESFRVLFDVRDPGKIANIETYLRALFNVLKSCRLTLSDILPFTFAPGDKDFDVYAPERWAILSRARGVAKTLPFGRRKLLEKNIYEVDLAYRNYNTWRSEIASTVRRMNTVFQSPTSFLLYNCWDGLNFESLVSDGWIVLVSVSDEVLDILEARLLATLVINNVIYSIERIRRNGFNKPYSMFIDEAGEYATRQVARALYYKQKILLWPVIAHQDMGQFEDGYIERAIRIGTKIKVGFYVEDQDQRVNVVKILGYGGELEPRDVAYTLRDQEQRTMVLKVGKKDPIVCKVHDTPDAPKNEDFIVKHILSSDNYVTEEKIEEDYGKRHRRENTASPTGTAKPNRRADSQGDKRQTKQRSQTAKASGTTEADKPLSNSKLKDVWEAVHVPKDGLKE